MEAPQPLKSLQRAEAIQGPDTAEDQRLVSAVLVKDRKATAEFVSRCADWVYAFVRRRLVPKGDVVEDLMQEIVFAAWHALPNFRGDANLRSWVMGIARHKLEDYYRKKIREIEMPDEDESLPEQAITPRFEQQLDLAKQKNKVQRILAALPETYALALLWQYRDERSVREMAQLAGKSEKAMERLLARARENFKRRWSDDGV